VVAHYRHLVESVERRLITWRQYPDGGATVAGEPITIGLSRPVQDWMRSSANYSLAGSRLDCGAFRRFPTRQPLWKPSICTSANT
jgi:hypothetical protein